MLTKGHVQLQAESSQLHDGKLLVRGDKFIASDAEAADLVAMHFASVVPQSGAKDEEGAPPSTTTRTRTRRISLQGDDDAAPAQRYGRRDLRAQD